MELSFQHNYLGRAAIGESSGEYVPYVSRSPLLMDFSQERDREGGHDHASNELIQMKNHKVSLNVYTN